jgi:hypothetical protein
MTRTDTKSNTSVCSFYSGAGKITLILEENQWQ